MNRRTLNGAGLEALWMKRIFMMRVPGSGSSVSSWFALDSSALIPESGSTSFIKPKRLMWLNAAGLLFQTVHNPVAKRRT